MHEPKRLTAWSPEVHPAWPRTSRVCVKVSCAPPDASVDPIGSPRVAAVGWQWLPYDSPSASGTGTPARRAKLGIVVRKVLLDLPAQRASAEILARPAPRMIEATDCLEPRGVSLSLSLSLSPSLSLPGDPANRKTVEIRVADCKTNIGRPVGLLITSTQGDVRPISRLYVSVVCRVAFRMRAYLIVVRRVAFHMRVVHISLSLSLSRSLSLCTRFRMYSVSICRRSPARW